ncbi:MAG: tetratricopeptide repeat protein [Coriobacteriia bacterium]|nr:tetratricopeptide repeat protein [Coriobacteriia bacterium]
MTGITRNKRLLVLAAAAAALAAVILVASSLSSPQGSGPRSSMSSSESRPGADLRAALDAERAGETTEAIALLRRLLEEDPSHTEARRALARVERTAARRPPADLGPGTGGGGGPDAEPPAGGGPGTDPGDPSAEGYDRPREDLGEMLPASVQGYRSTGAESGPADAQVTLEPRLGTEVFGKVTVASMVVRDMGSLSGAAAFVAGTGKAYPNGLSDVKVGVLNGKSGTDGRRLVSVSFARGRFAFEVLLTATSGDPVSYKDEAVRLASLIPATK